MNSDGSVSASLSIPDAPPARTSHEENVVEERLSGARLAKEEGNAAFQRGDLCRASFCYKKVYLYLADYLEPRNTSVGDDPMLGAITAGRRQTPRVSNAAQEEVRTLYAAAQNNLALVLLKLGRHADGARCATNVLSIPGYEQCGKALMRRAACRIRLGLLEEAERDLETADAMGSDSATHTLREELETAKKQSAQAQRKMCQKMFAA